MTLSSRGKDSLMSHAYKNVYSPASAASSLARPRSWKALVRELRQRLGCSQSALAERLGVTQASVSRWENGQDLPSIGLRKTMRDMLRTADTSQMTRQLKARLRYTPFPMSMVGHGARFLDFSPSFAAETATEPGTLRGRSIYGRFGEIVDATTESWERSGIFNGDVAMTLTVLRLNDPGGEPLYLRNLDTPHLLDNDEVITICETCRISQAEFDQHITAYGNPVFYLSYDEIVD